jgi:DNA mismatch repair protein MutH
MQITAPKDLSELQQRCQALAGLSIYQIAEKLGLKIPENLLHAKGWVGQLIEVYLGASASSKAMPDFPGLNIELKTIPIDSKNKPLESTYVCTVQANNSALAWRDSWVYNKLKHVLWVPILSTADLAITNRIITKPFFWQMDQEIEDILRTDWEELMDMLVLGYGKDLSAKYGTYLHIRPKAASSQVLIDYTDADGTATKIVPKGFYLRSSFTRLILEQTQSAYSY